jgi:hypothetical protein
VNAKALSTFMGHSSITITLDRYGHLFPGSENEAADLLDAYLARTATTETGRSSLTNDEHQGERRRPLADQASRTPDRIY